MIFFNFFTAENNFCILHGHVAVMKRNFIMDGKNYLIST